MNSTVPQLTAYERAVLVTLAYTDQFSHPLTFDELCARCLRLELSDTEVSMLKVRHALKHLITLKIVQSKDQLGETFYFLVGRSALVSLREERASIGIAKQQEINVLLNFLKRIPSVQAVFLTGSQAMNSADACSDIDFMIVTSPKRLWLTRILVSMFAQLKGKRRSWNNEEEGSWCFNLWLDTQHLQVVPAKQDSYRAYEVYQAQELWSKQGVGQLFFQANSWISRYFFVQLDDPVKQLPVNDADQRSLIDLADWLAWKLQSLYMKRHQTTEQVGRGFAFFHPRDTGRMIKDGWLTSLSHCLPKDEAARILQPYVRTE